MKKFVCLILSICLVFSLTLTVSASTISSNSSTQYDITTVSINGTLIEVPVLKSTPVLSSSDGVITSTHTVFVPDGSTDSLALNKVVVSEIKQYGTPKTRGYGDFYVNGYIWFHSTLNYNTVQRSGVNYYDLISFKLEREVYVESVFNSFNNADAHVMQIGADYYDNQDSLLQESHYYDISYGTLYSIPASWIPVYNVGYFIGVEYSVEIDFNNDLNLTDYVLTYIHQAV